MSIYLSYFNRPAIIAYGQGKTGIIMPALTNFIKRRINEKAAIAARDFFINLRLPQPEISEAYESCDSGTLIFLQDEACVIRLASPLLTTCVDSLKNISFAPVVD